MTDRTRINKVNGKYMFRVGDLLRANLPGTHVKHICIILEDEPTNGHIKCLQVCNFTSKLGQTNDYSIDVSKFDLPNYWFDNKKPESWIRCNEIGCIHMIDFTENDLLGNLIDSFPELWKEVCRSTINCPISTRLQKLCDCEYEKINILINDGEIAMPDCGCS